MVILGIITTLLTGLLGWLIKAIMSWCLQVYDTMFYNAMAVETCFYDVIDNGLFNITGLYKAIYTFAIALLIMFFVKKLVEVYFAWSNRRPRNITFISINRFHKSTNYNDFIWIYLRNICRNILSNV